jgi:hypothetical protein
LLNPIIHSFVKITLIDHTKEWCAPFLCNACYGVASDKEFKNAKNLQFNNVVKL